MIFLALACTDKKTSETTAAADGSTSEEATENAPLIPHPLIDNKGQVMAHMTFPGNWKLHNEPGKAAFTGPNGVFVYNIPMRNFAWTNDQMMASVYQQNGGRLRQPLSGEAIVKQDLEPIAKKEGSKLIRVYDAPEIAKSDGSMSCPEIG